MLPVGGLGVEIGIVYHESTQNSPGGNQTGINTVCLFIPPLHCYETSNVDHDDKKYQHPDVQK